MAMNLEVAGNAAKDARIAMTAGGVEIASLTVAVTKRDRNGEQVAPAYVPVLVFGPEKIEVAKKVAKGDYVVARGAMSTPESSEDGKYINFHVTVSDADAFSFVTRKPRREKTVANSELAEEDMAF